MLRLEGFSRTPGWQLKDVDLNGLRTQMGLKLSTGAEEGSRNLHRHNPGEKEFFFVLSGSAKAMVDGEEITLGLGEGQTDFLLMENEEHGIFDKSLDYACIILFLKPQQ